MKKVLLSSMIFAVLSIFISAVSLTGYSYAGSKEAGTRDIAIAKLQTIREAHIAKKRLEALKTGNHGGINSGPASSWITKVNPNEVNMVTNHFESEAQGVIKIDGNSYYGSCEGCAENMKNNPSTRFATDPFTNSVVDKSKASIFADASGRVWYFESENSHKDLIGLVDRETLFGYAKPE